MGHSACCPAWRCRTGREPGGAGPSGFPARGQAAMVRGPGRPFGGLALRLAALAAAFAAGCESRIVRDGPASEAPSRVGVMNSVAGEGSACRGANVSQALLNCAAAARAVAAAGCDTPGAATTMVQLARHMWRTQLAALGCSQLEHCCERAPSLCSFSRDPAGPRSSATVALLEMLVAADRCYNDSGPSWLAPAAYLRAAAVAGCAIVGDTRAAVGVANGAPARPQGSHPARRTLAAGCSVATLQAATALAGLRAAADGAEPGPAEPWEQLCRSQEVTSCDALALVCLSSRVSAASAAAWDAGALGPGWQSCGQGLAGARRRWNGHGIGQVFLVRQATAGSAHVARSVMASLAEGAVQVAALRERAVAAQRSAGAATGRAGAMAAAAALSEEADALFRELTARAAHTAASVLAHKPRAAAERPHPAHAKTLEGEAEWSWPPPPSLRGSECRGPAGLEGGPAGSAPGQPATASLSAESLPSPSSSVWPAWGEAVAASWGAMEAARQAARAGAFPLCMDLAAQAEAAFPPLALGARSQAGVCAQSDASTAASRIFLGTSFALVPLSAVAASNAAALTVGSEDTASQSLMAWSVLVGMAADEAATRFWLSSPPFVLDAVAELLDSSDAVDTAAADEQAAEAAAQGGGGLGPRGAASSRWSVRRSEQLAARPDACGLLPRSCLPRALTLESGAFMQPNSSYAASGRSLCASRSAFRREQALDGPCRAQAEAAMAGLQLVTKSPAGALPVPPVVLSNAALVFSAQGGHSLDALRSRWLGYHAAAEPVTLAAMLTEASFMSAIVDSPAVAVRERAQALRGLLAVQAAVRLGRAAQPDAKQTPHLFYLPYRGWEDDLPLLELAAGLARPPWAAPPPQPWPRSQAAQAAASIGLDQALVTGGRPARVLFVSRFFTLNHAHGQLVQGMLAGLDRSRFRVILGTITSEGMYVDPALEAVADEVQRVRPGQGELDVHEVGADAVIYTDQLSEGEANRLAYRRLAPVQAVFWGNPTTSGKRDCCADFFLSADRMEADAWRGGEARHPLAAGPGAVAEGGPSLRLPPPVEAQGPGAAAGEPGWGQYTEQLLRFQGQGIWYDPLELPPPGRLGLNSRFGLPRGGGTGCAASDPACSVLLGCMQSSFKLQPGLDAVLAATLRALPGARLVVVYARQQSWQGRLERRWRATMSDVMDRVLVVPRQANGPAFFEALSCVDVIVHPTPFGGSKTAADALALRIPIVAMPSRLLRARMARSLLVSAGLPSLLARSPAHMVRLLVRLASSPALRRQVSAAMAASGDLVWSRSEVPMRWQLWLETVLHLPLAARRETQARLCALDAADAAAWRARTATPAHAAVRQALEAVPTALTLSGAERRTWGGAAVAAELESGGLSAAVDVLGGRPLAWEEPSSAPRCGA